jgi:hypothetical protein
MYDEEVYVVQSDGLSARWHHAQAAGHGGAHCDSVPH